MHDHHWELLARSLAHPSRRLLLEHHIWGFGIQPDPHRLELDLEQFLLLRRLCRVDYRDLDQHSTHGVPPSS
jgi:hypothetical protein